MVYVYPNPYRIDDRYRDEGYEGLMRENWSSDRLRTIYFANLPPKCFIRIFSLDGDLIRRLIHDFDPDDPMASHQRWDLITRNRQAVTSGLFYWTVEFEDGSVQIGKLAIIM